MSSQDKRRGEDSVAAVIDFLLANARLVLGVGGAAVLGIATLAVKRLLERASRVPDEKPDQKLMDGWEELSLVTSSPKMLKKGIEVVVMKQIAAAAKAHKADQSQQTVVVPQQIQLCLSLQERLQHYYHTRAHIPVEQVRVAQQRALDVCTEIQGFLRCRHADMPLGEMVLGGSLLDDLQVVCADHACLLVPLQLEDGLWEPVRGEDTILCDPQFWLLRRCNQEYFPRGRSYWDGFLVGGYLSSGRVCQVLEQGLLQRMNWPALDSSLGFMVRPVVKEQCRLRLETVPPDGVQPLTLDILPMVRVDGASLLAEGSEATWLCSTYEVETSCLSKLDEGDGGVRRRLLKILKAAFQGNPNLSVLTGRHLTSVVLHLSQREPTWPQEALADRFEQALTDMVAYLEDGCLPGYFTPKVNLLSAFTEEQVDKMGFTLYCAISEPDILLHT